MTKIICNVDCQHRSKMPLRSYTKRNGEKCYGCSLDAVSISRIFDPDNYVVEVVGEGNMAVCMYYKPVEESDA